MSSEAKNSSWRRPPRREARSARGRVASTEDWREVREVERWVMREARWDWKEARDWGEILRACSFCWGFEEDEEGEEGRDGGASVSRWASRRVNWVIEGEREEGEFVSKAINERLKIKRAYLLKDPGEGVDALRVDADHAILHVPCKIALSH
jgi:hypothetical protein